MNINQPIPLTDNAKAVLERRYLIKDNKGRVIETPNQLFVRVANAIAAAERNYGADDAKVAATAEEFYSLMARLDFLPNSPTLMNAGRPLGQLSACFVLPVGDSIDEIFETNKHAALIHKSGGGTGFSFSRLRPRNSVVQSTSGIASGPVSFMKVYNASTEEIKQGGTRRGANMGILRVDHPDILDFISSKADTSEITNFNISVAITDDFMAALESDTDYSLIDPRSNRPYIVDGAEAKLNAREVYRQIVDHAWATGEPGLVFIDRMNRGNPTHPSETIEATNPCGEQPLPPYDSCNLGSINVGNFVKNPLPNNYSPSEPWHGVDEDHLRKAIRVAVNFLDNVIDQNNYPLDEIEQQSRKNRRIGLGVMGFADMLVKLHLPYNHEKAFEAGERLMQFVHTEARTYSSELATKRGKFPNWDGSIFKEEGVAMRNATVTTVAPTGTISIIAGCSSGIEPYYSLAFERNVMDGTRLVESNPLFDQIARDEGFHTGELMKIIAGRRSITDLEPIPQRYRAIFLTAADVSPEDHVKMQAAFQRHCDASVSKTINFPEEATRDHVEQSFNLAWQLGCKGITIYRDNSRPNQVLSSKPAVKETGPKPVASRPDVLTGFTEKIRTGYGNLYVTVNMVDGRPFEVFAHIGKSGYTTMADTEAICRLISLSLRAHIPVEQIIKQLKGIGGSSQVFTAGRKIASIPDAIAHVLSSHFLAPDEHFNDVFSGEICPECSSVMVDQSGCFVCRSCGYSNC